MSSANCPQSGTQCLVCTRTVPICVLTPQPYYFNCFDLPRNGQLAQLPTLPTLSAKVSDYFKLLNENLIQSEFCHNCISAPWEVGNNKWESSKTHLMKFGDILDQLGQSIQELKDKIQTVAELATMPQLSANQLTNQLDAQSLPTDEYCLGQNVNDAEDSMGIPISLSSFDESDLCPISPDMKVFSDKDRNDFPEQKAKDKSKKRKRSRTGRRTSNNRRRTKRPPAHKGPFVCNICNKVLSAQIHLNNHMLTHTNEKPYECNICQKRFRHNPALFLHKRNHEGIKPYKCDLCDKTFSTKWKMGEHRKSHFSDKPIFCEYCPMRFITKSYLKNHMINSHPETRPPRYAPENLHKCSFCDKLFLIKSGLEKHIFSAHKVDERPWICETCGKKFATGSLLKRHVDQVHLKVPYRKYEKKHKCTECEKMFKTPSDLKQHLNAHSNKTVIKCEICAIKLRQGLLEKHRKRHEESKDSDGNYLRLVVPKKEPGLRTRGKMKTGSEEEWDYEPKPKLQRLKKRKEGAKNVKTRHSSDEEAWSMLDRIDEKFGAKNYFNYESTEESDSESSGEYSLL